MNRHQSILACCALFVVANSPFAHVGEEQKLLASDGVAGDSFGRSLFLSHETLIVGAPFADVNGDDSGAAYVFVFDELAESWVEEQKLVPDDPMPGDFFGWSVAVHEDIAVIGAYGNDDLGQEAGAAYVFTRTAGVWTQQQKLTASNGVAGDGFGFSVGLDETTALVGAPQFLGAVPGPGAAYAFLQAGAVWSEEDVLAASDPLNGAQFGRSVYLSHDRAAIGAPRATGSAALTGAAYVHSRTAGVWSEDEKVVAADGQAGDIFGISVALFDETDLAVGAAGDDDNGNNSGAAYTYDDDGAGFVLGIKLRGISAGDKFGQAVGRQYRGTLAGARLDDDEAENAGTAHLYLSQGPLGTNLGEVYVANDAAMGDALGWSVTLDECWVAVGAVGSDTMGGDAGAVYMYVNIHPGVQTYNGSGINPLCMTSTELPAIGGDWHIEVDASGVGGAVSTYVFGRLKPRPAPLLLAFGELLVDRQSPAVFDSVMMGSGLNEHVVPVPNDPWINGMRLEIQAAVLGGGGVLALCNAEGIRIGCSHHHEE